ncbi:MAG: hypothetical protein M9928_17760 [Anaerolineae bacterium]|nr:hypothetical protein [Anaerolineae bacterium]
MEKPEFATSLVTIVYGDNPKTNQRSSQFGTLSDLKGIISPTTVGIRRRRACAMQDQDRIGEVFVTGLGTPNQMREYVKQHLRHCSVESGRPRLRRHHALNAIATGEWSIPATFDADRLVSYTIASCRCTGRLQHRQYQRFFDF